MCARWADLFIQQLEVFFIWPLYLRAEKGQMDSFICRSRYVEYSLGQNLTEITPLNCVRKIVLVRDMVKWDVVCAVIGRKKHCIWHNGTQLCLRSFVALFPLDLISSQVVLKIKPLKPNSFTASLVVTASANNLMVYEKFPTRNVPRGYNSLSFWQEVCTQQWNVYIQNSSFSYRNGI